MERKTAYIKVANKKDRSIINELLLEGLKECDINWTDDIAELSTTNNDAFEIQLKKILYMAIQDIGLQASILIVPFFNQIFIKYLDSINNQVSTSFEVFIKHINDINIKKDSKKILQMMEQKDIDTLKAFLQCNCNSSLAANELFLHRNSMNYRLNHLINSMNIDIRDTNTIMFFNLIFNICA